MIEYIKAWGRICNIPLYLSGQSKYSTYSCIPSFIYSNFFPTIYLLLFTLVSDVPQFHCPLFFYYPLPHCGLPCSYYNKGVGMLILGRIRDISFLCSPCAGHAHIPFPHFFTFPCNLPQFYHPLLHHPLPRSHLSCLHPPQCSCVTFSCMHIFHFNLVLLLQVNFKEDMAGHSLLHGDKLLITCIHYHPLYVTHKVVEGSQCQL